MSETLRVSPMPSIKSAPSATLLFTVPGMSPPASVTPMCSGKSVFFASSLYAATVVKTSEDLMDILMSSWPSAATRSTFLMALSTNASGVAP